MNYAGNKRIFHWLNTGLDLYFTTAVIVRHSFYAIYINIDGVWVLVLTGLLVCSACCVLSAGRILVETQN